MLGMAHHKPMFYIWLLLPLMSISGFGIDIYTPSLPIITHFLGASQAAGKLTIAFYILGFGVGQTFVGPLSDQFGRKVTLISALLLFIIAALLSTFSKTIDFLLAMRMLQGLGMAGLVLNVRVIATDFTSGSDLRRAMIYVTTAWAISPIIGPFLGGWLQTMIGWKAGFYLLALAAFVMLILIIIYLPESNINRRRTNLKQIVKNYTTVLSSWSYMKNVTGLLLAFTIINVFNIVGPFIIQVELHHSPLFYGHLALLVGIAFFLGSLLNRVLMHILKINQVILFAIILSIVVSSIALIIAVNTGLTILMIIIPVLLIIFCMGMLYPNYSANCSSMFRSIAGTAAAVRGVVSMISAAMIMSLISVIKINEIYSFLVSYLILAILCLLIFLLRPKNKGPSSKI